MNYYSVSQNATPHRPRPSTVTAVVVLLSLNALLSVVHVVAAVTTPRDAILGAMVDAVFGDYVPPEAVTDYTVTVAVLCGIQAVFWLWMAIAAYRGHNHARILSLAIGVPVAIFGTMFDGFEGVTALPQTALTLATLVVTVLGTSMMWSCGYRHYFNPPHWHGTP